MKRIALFAVLGLGGCAAPPPPAYHPLAEHPFAIKELAANAHLDATTPTLVVEQARRFADARPNNGSSFTVRAPSGAAETIARAILSTGVAPKDIRVVTSADNAIERIDRVVTPEGCEGAPEAAFRPGLADDGYTHDNANSALFGCAVRRNIAAMVDDPRTLVASDRFSGHDGARSADVYAKWIKGQRTETESAVSATKTSDVPGGDASK